MRRDDLRQPRILLAACVLGLAPAAASADQQQRARQLGAVCAACHRADGANSGIPAIAGLDAVQITQRMNAYRAEAHGNQIMHVIASSITPEETALLAQYFARQTPAAAGR